MFYFYSHKIVFNFCQHLQISLLHLVDFHITAIQQLLIKKNTPTLFNNSNKKQGKNIPHTTHASLPHEQSVAFD